jgi:dTDP-4-dehydrorhamnose 3,5-epimerase
MSARELRVPGAWEFSRQVYTDDRGVFFETFTQREFTQVTGHRLEVAQINCSVSAAGVLRGLHFSQLPPSQAKYVTCMRGAVLDVIVDIRVGSPTYGQWDSVELDDRTRRSVYISEGLAHAFYALEDESTVMYLCSTPYAPDREHVILATDPRIGIVWPTVDGAPTRMSGRDLDAPTLDDVRAAGLLPTWDEARDFVERLRDGLSR